MNGWLLVDDDEAPVAECAEIDGLFAALPPRPRERFTLIGCEPEDALAGRLGNVWLTPAGAEPGDLGEYLCGLVVGERRPSQVVPGTVDIDLDGFVHVYDRTDAVHRPAAESGFVLTTVDDTPLGRCRDVTGVFRDEGEPPVPQIRLLGCRPGPVMLTAIRSLGLTSKAAHRRRMIHTGVSRVVPGSPPLNVYGWHLSGSVSAAEPSALGEGLVDITVDSDPLEPLPTGVRGIVERFAAGRPALANLWAGYDRELRHHWCGVALAAHAGRPDRPPGGTYHLDGRFVTDVEGFYCAIGEAINGPGGYFGWNLDALDDCLFGGFGVHPPFRLAWHDSAVAREHLVDGYDQRRMEPAVTFDYLVDLLTSNGVEVDQR
jgi:RNAse (barnase) inhibitor barstar